MDRVRAPLEFDRLTGEDSPQYSDSTGARRAAICDCQSKTSAPIDFSENTGAVYDRQPGRLTLLVIHDDTLSRQRLVDALDCAGYRVCTAANGSDGLSVAVSCHVDAILVDRELSGRINSEAVIVALKRNAVSRAIPCLLLRSGEGGDEESRGGEWGADACIPKNASIDQILGRIAMLLHAEDGEPTGDAGELEACPGQRILVAGENAPFLSELLLELRHEGYDAVHAESGERSLELLHDHSIGCILLDERLPDISGYEVCRQIKLRQKFRSIPLLMLTEGEQPETVVEGIDSGADDYISKSSDFTVLKAGVRAQLRRKQFEDDYLRLREELHESEMDNARARAAQEIAEARAAMVDELEEKNRELEAFAYSASHDLRAPLRTVKGFTKAILDDFGPQLPLEAKENLGRVQRAALRMSQLIDALLDLSRSGRTSLVRETIDLTELARSLAREQADSDRNRHVECAIDPGMVAKADPSLVRAVLSNLLSNAWKFTGATRSARIEIGMLRADRQFVYFVRDNGAGFDSTHAKSLFQPFIRLHSAADFPGAGIGLATVRRIIERHGGQIWAQSVPGEGATFFFTLEAPPEGAH